MLWEFLEDLVGRLNGLLVLFGFVHLLERVLKSARAPRDAPCTHQKLFEQALLFGRKRL